VCHGDANAGCQACSVVAGASADGTCTKLTGTPCDDGNACTQTDTCQAGICTGSKPVTCTATDTCHDVGVCDPASGVCSNPAKKNGSPCNDGNACTQTDVCHGGACIGGNPVTCVAEDVCHDPGVCDALTGMCSSPEKPDGTACATGTCQAGACTDSSSS